MKITRIRIENALGISEELAFEPGNMNLISGGTGKGKSSFLECLEKAFTNDNRRELFTRLGADKAYIHIETDDGLTIDKSVNTNGEVYTKVVKDGKRINKPETYLKSLVNGFNFNPVGFINLKEKEQTAILLGLIPATLAQEHVQEWFGELPPVLIDDHALVALKRIEKHYYDRRTIANQALGNTTQQITALEMQLPNLDEIEAARPKSIEEIYNRRDAAQKVNLEIDAAQENLSQHTEKLLALQNQEKTEIQGIELRARENNADIEKKHVAAVNSWRFQIAELQRKIEELQGKINGDDELKHVEVLGIADKMRDQLKATTEKYFTKYTELEAAKGAAEITINHCQKTDLEVIKAEAVKLEGLKGFIPLADNLVKARVDRVTQEALCQRLENQIMTARSKPTEIIAQMEMPIKGLGIGADGEITINGLPIKNLSSGQQIGLSLDIAKVTIGDLSCICVDGLERLDPEARDEFKAICESDTDIQYFCTMTCAGPLKIESK